MTSKEADKKAAEFLKSVKRFGRVDSNTLAASIGMTPRDIDWQIVLVAAHYLARSSGVPLTYTPDLMVWTTAPTPGDAICNHVWDVAYAVTRLDNSARDLRHASTPFNRRKAFQPVRKQITIVYSTAASLHDTNEEVREMLTDLREYEYEKGLI